MDIGDVVKVEIDGKMMSCIIIGNLIEGKNCPSINDFNYLSIRGPNGHKIFPAGRPVLWDCYKTLIGDKIVYVETRDILEWI